MIKNNIGNYGIELKEMRWKTFVVTQVEKSFLYVKAIR